MLDNIEQGFTKEQLEAVMDVFTTDGWKIIQYDMSLYLKQRNSVKNIDSIEKLHHLKGELDTLDWFVHLKDWYEAAEAIHEADI